MWLTILNGAPVLTVLGTLLGMVKLKFVRQRDRERSAVLQDKRQGAGAVGSGKKADAEPEAPVPGMVAILIVALGDEDIAVRLHVVRTLGRLGRQASAAIPALRRAQWDRAPVVRQAATDALAKIV